MRQAPSTSGAILTVLPIGTSCTVLSGPTSASGYQWYRINCGSRGIGYVAGDYLTVVSAASVDSAGEASTQVPSTATVVPTETVTDQITVTPLAPETETPIPTEEIESLAPPPASPEEEPLAPIETPTDIPVLEPQPLPIVRIQRSEGSSAGQSLVDRDSSTVWMTDGAAVVPLAAFVADLDAPQYVSVIRWQIASEGLSGTLHVSVSTDNENWTDLTVDTIAAPGEWQELPVDASVQYIRFVFVNDDGLPVVGGIAEIEVWP
jgi:hypothetical protein